jgi:hypothetical protein
MLRTLRQSARQRKLWRGAVFTAPYMLYSHKDGCTFNTLRVTVSMLNRRILDVGYRILNVKEYGYRLVRTSRSQAMTTTGEWSPVDIQCN